MYLSRLHVNIGSDPDKPNPGRQWLCNLYHVHQRLCMAFPSAEQKEGDREFPKPFDPNGFQHVHGPRTKEQAFLFRLDPLPGGDPAILVQSALKPDWDYAFHNAGFLLAAPPQTRELSPEFYRGQSLGFRLLANPTRKIGTKSRADGTKSNGRRVPVKFEQLGAWLARQGERGGFSFADDSVTRQPGYVHVHENGKDMNRLFSVRFDGLLRVTDPDAFRETVVRGIGPAKAFGFGLLSVAPVKL